jgi:hypothetical protein
MASRAIVIPLLKHMRAKPGQVMHYSDVAEAIDRDGQNVSTALARMVLVHPEYGVRRVGGDHSGQYIYRPDYVELTNPEAEPEPTDRLGMVYETIGYVGRVPLVRDTNGDVWTIVPLKIGE